MISVVILINGQPIMARSATCCATDKYSCDDGAVINHKYDDGAVKLAIKMLEKIKETGVKA